MAGEACAEGPAREGLTVPGSESTASRTSSARLAVAAVWRVESARIVATLVRTTGDFARAEDLAQELSPKHSSSGRMQDCRATGAG